MDNYISDKKIMLVIETEDLTPLGNGMVEVSFEDGTKEVMPKKRLDMLTTQEISSESLSRETLRKEVGSIIFGLMHEYGIKVNEVDPVLDTAVELVNNASTKCYEILFGYEKTLIPLNAINKILVENNYGNKTS